MPKYLGKGKQFFLVSCELMGAIPKNATFEYKKRFHEDFCNRCAYWIDAIERQEKAVAEGESWRRLVCIRPDDKQALQKFSPHITEWANR